ncbi:MAG: hypothetical protein GEU75_00880 [Dehalococcoidia bacterium]|nr:hypothetical protein [Dehalococcoidia bacterium]
MGRLEGSAALPFILGSKLATLALVLVAFLFFPLNEPQQQENFNYPVQSDLAERFTPWDASHYLHLSDQGYQPEQMSNAFAPLYPLLIKAAHVAVPDRILAALLVSNLASAVALYLLYVYCKRRYGEGPALKTLLALLALPTTFFLNLIYSEAVFLLLSVLFFWGLYTRNPGVGSYSGVPAAAVPAGGLCGDRSVWLISGSRRDGGDAGREVEATAARVGAAANALRPVAGPGAGSVRGVYAGGDG